MTQLTLSGNIMTNEINLMSSKDFQRIKRNEAKVLKAKRSKQNKTSYRNDN